ncbi:MAG: DUF3638 domain-containing protein [Verrucomicrobia bacterium]|nr:DUF3638 domain-containing protein [Verrucomicrobiota bacterium]
MERLLSQLDKAIALTHDNKSVVTPIQEITLFFKKAINFLFGDHVWYSEAKARKIVKYYIWHAQADQVNQARTEKVCQLFDKLSLRFTRGLDRSWIEDAGKEGPAFIRQKKFPVASDRQFFHIHADEFGANSELEGDSCENSLKFIGEYMKRHKSTLPPDLIEEVHNATELAFSDDYVATGKSQLTEAIKAKKPMLIAAGWRGNPGHAMCYEILPAENGHSSLRIYNTGAGVNNHPSIYVGNKQKYRAYAEWHGIDTTRLLDDTFWQVLKEIIGHKTEVNDEYEEADVYVGLKNLLKPISINTEKPIQDECMSPQMSGICSTRSLMAFLRTRLGYQEYKRFRLSLRLQTLVDTVKSYTGKTPFWHYFIPKRFENALGTNKMDLKRRERLIEKSRNKLALSIEKLHRNKVIGDKFLTSSVNQLAKTDEAIALIRSKRRIGKVRSNQLYYQKPSVAVTLPASIIPLHIQIENNESLPSTGATICIRKGDDCTTVAKLASEGWLKGEDGAIYSGLMDWICAQSITKEAWSCEKKIAEQQLAALGTISRVLFKTCFMLPNAKAIDVERVYAMRKLLWIQFQLLSSIDEELASRIGITTSYDAEHSPFFAQDDALMKREYFEMREKMNNGLNLSAGLVEHDHKKAYYQPITENGNLDKLITLLMALCPEVERSLANRTVHWNSLNQRVKEAEFYTCDELPDWIKALRDTGFCLNYLFYGAIANPGFINRNIDLSLDWSSSHNSGNSGVYVKVHGLPPEMYQNSSKQRIEKIRFWPNYRSFILPESTNFLIYWLTSQNNSEKKLLADHVKNHDIGILDEEFKELAHLLVKPQMRSLETFALFTKDPTYTQILDFQVLLYLILFAPDTKPLPRKEAVKFLETHIELFLAKNEIQSVVFLLQLMRKFSTFYPDEKAFQGALDRLRDMARRAGLEPYEKSLIYRELIINLGNKEVLQPLEYEELLLAHAYVVDNPIHPRWSDPQVDNELFRTIHRHAAGLIEVCEPLLNRILTTLRPQESPSRWVKNGSHFSTIDTRHTFDPVSGRLLSSDCEVNIPVEIQQHRHFNSNFGNVQKAISKPGGIYKFDNVLVQKVGDTLHAECHYDGEWYRFIPEKTFLKDDKSLIISRFLQNGYSEWQSLKDPSKLIFMNGSVDYQAKYVDGSIQEVTRLSDGARLGVPSDFLKNFEEREYTHFWYDKSSKQQEIELPRYGLSFSSTLECRQIPGFFLCRDQNVDELRPFNHYILLQNAKGQKKVLMPLERFIKRDNHKESLIPKHMYVEQNELSKRYVQFDLKPNGKLFSVSQEANLYLVECLTLVQEYAKASFYLKKYGEKLTKYSADERQILTSLLTLGKVNGDSDGDAASLKAYAGYLLSKNGKVSPDQKRHVISAYIEYLKHYKKAVTCRLETHEERFLLALAGNSNPIVYQRHWELSGTRIAAKRASCTTRKSIKDAFTLPSPIGISRLDPNLFRDMTITRAHQLYDRYIDEIFLIAKYGSDQDKKKIRDSLAFLGISKKKRKHDRSIALLLETALENPNLLPDPPKRYHLGEFDKWQKSCGEILQLQPVPDAIWPIPEIVQNQFCLDEKSPPIAEIEVSLNFTDSQADLASLQKEILALANRAPSFSLAKAKEQLLKWGGLRKDVELDDVLMAFARKDTVQLRKKNPALEEKDFEPLFAKVGQFLQLATNDPEKSERAFNPQQHPAYLVFEYYADLRLRPVQVEKLEAFLSGKNPNLIMEMIMGSGKSKVLLPLLGLLRADRETLSLLIVPEPLFATVSNDTQAILREAFGQKLRSLHFDRNTPLDVDALRTYIDDIKNIKENRDCLIMTSKSVQCLILKLIEEANRYFTKENPVPEQLILLQSLVREIAASGYPIIDEADTILNVLHEVCVSLGERQSPKENEISLISEIYDLLLTDSELKAIAALECDKEALAVASAITEDLYEKRLKRPLAEKMVQRLEDSGRFITAERDALLDYLTREGDRSRAQNFFDAQSEEMQDLLALLGEEISNLLKHTLTRNSNERYGLDNDQSGILAIPYSAANKPCSGSQFANAYVTMNYTFQTYLKRGITRVHIIRALETLQNRALIEMKQDSVQLKETAAYRQFCTLKGDIDMPLFKFKEEHLQLLDEKINASIATKRAFIEKIILPQLELFERKISCNSHNLISFFKNVTGFTGTLWNGASMHRKLQLAEEKGLDDKTLALLRNKRSKVLALKGNSMEGVLSQIVEQTPFDLLSDAGGYFKDDSNRSIAEMVEKKVGKPCVYFDAKGDLFVTEDKTFTETALKAEERVTFLDQSHTTGADVPQKPDAVGIVTIGRNMLLRDLLQSAWRLRALDKAQSVVFVLSEEVQSIIGQDREITLEDIIAFCTENQTRQQGKDNFKAFMQELWDIPQQLLLRKLMSEKFEDLHDAYKLLQETWIRPVCKSPRELYGTIAHEEQTDAVVAAELEQLKRFLAKIPGQDSTAELEKVKAHMIKALPKTVVRKDSNDQTLEIEQERLTETELEEQGSDFLEKVELGVKAYSATPEVVDPTDELFTCREIRAFDLGLFMKQDAELSQYAEAFSGIHATTNVLEFAADNKSLRDAALLGSHRTPFQFLAVDGNNVTILSQEETFPNTRGLYNLTLGFCIEDKRLTKEAFEKIVKVKFLDGESHFRKEELAVLKEWFKLHGPAKMRAFYLKHVLSGRPLKAIEYNQSSLSRLFASFQ